MSVSTGWLQVRSRDLDTDLLLAEEYYTGRRSESAEMRGNYLDGVALSSEWAGGCGVIWRKGSQLSS